ncbi:MAG: hypothetical protein M1827_002604 [Pycnora praestabilis]|nr:MAG: hypothetical protein M1827_002604 [Pycnora praestabilis]
MAGLSISRKDVLAFEFNESDREVLAQTDEDFHLQTWEDLKLIISENNLAVLKRKPSDLIRYIEWTRETNASHGSISNFICKRRLHWKPLKILDVESGPVFAYNDATPFADKNDYKILRNDWPYGITPDVTHLVVWLKTPIPVDTHTGDLTPQSRRLIQDFVERSLQRRLAGDSNTEDRVQWFKNWTGLQSVRGLEHVHILVRNAPEHLLAEWTEN